MFLFISHICKSLNALLGQPECLYCSGDKIYIVNCVLNEVMDNMVNDNLKLFVIILCCLFGDI